MTAIDHDKEFSGVLESLNKAGMKINYCKVQATVDKITETLSEGPIAIHFSGHGLRGHKTPNSVKLSPLIPQTQGYLVLEDKNGQAQYIRDSHLKDIIESSTKPEFVFVASCHSQFAGNIFH